MQGLADLDRAFEDIDDEARRAAIFGNAALLSARNLGQLRCESRNYIPLDIFLRQTRDAEPFHLMHGAGARGLGCSKTGTRLGDEVCSIAKI
jgi:hypothetical protein